MDCFCRKGLTDELGAEAMMFDSLEKVEREIKKPLMRDDKKLCLHVCVSHPFDASLGLVSLKEV